MVVYIDIIFLENMVLNFIILYVAAIISKSKVKTLKILLRKHYRSFIFCYLLLYKKSWTVEYIW